MRKVTVSLAPGIEGAALGGSSSRLVVAALNAASAASRASVGRRAMRSILKIVSTPAHAKACRISLVSADAIASSSRLQHQLAHERERGEREIVHSGLE